ncbi:histidinol-phosphatase HisJ family protein [Neomoorella thermoacetica]|uniref:histidinol-phosphatase HisJ family protein n=1 Tax=Neomoorella thermoacetica TaxID=1525 RepID=UPI0008FB00C1|nr:histidinol-phosphatase HisJ family protein [Moorella thermoacetica]APC07937.1 histidinol-phosphatase [Moorella thermoacetica]
MPSDYHIHGLAHEGPPHTVERLLPYVEAAREAGLTAMGFADHDRFLEGLDFNVFAELERITGMPVRAGLEVDFRPGRDHRQQLAGRPWDYLIGSVHTVDDWEFDRPGQEGGFAAWDIDELYATYFNLVARAAATGIFQIIGHLDLIKIYGHRPRRPVLELAEPALQAIARSGAALEVNTAGLFKPVGEIYPARELLERAFSLNIPVTIGSDAHAPGEVAREREQARELLRQIGYTCLATFYCREMATEPLL